MLIFIVPTSYPNDSNPIANSFVEEQTKYLSREPKNKIVVLNVQKQPSSYILKNISKSVFESNRGYNAEIICTKVKTFAESIFTKLNYKIFTKALRRLFEFAIKKYGYPDIIYAHFYAASCSCYDIVKDSIPIVTMEHSGEIMNNRIKKSKKRMLIKSVNVSKRFLATTHTLKEKIISITSFRGVIDVVPNLVDDIFAFSNPPSSYFRFFSLARLEYDKRIDLLIESFCQAFNKDDCVELYIGGAGKERKKLEKIVKKNNREKQIIFLGALSRQESANNMKNCSCFVLPSRHETFGLVWREALCSGRPVITTNHGGFSSFDWRDDFGYMIPVDDGQALVQALLKIKNNYQTYDFESISKINSSFYSSSSFCNIVMSVFYSAIKYEK